MARPVSCSVAKKVNSTIRKKINGALKDMKNNQPRTASTKLYQVGFFIRERTKGVWDKKSTLWLGHEAIWLSYQLCNDVTMRLPKWRSRTETMLTKLSHLERRSESSCK